MKADWNQIIDAATAFRRELHRHPELTWKEVETARRIRERLDALGIGWRDCATHGTVATLASSAGGPHVALRADIDALPIQEPGGFPDTSEAAGCMHACGHDGHTAVLWATAAWLKANESALPGPVSLLFQPAEEGGHGAREMVKDGALKGVDIIYGWHNWPALAFGTAVCPDGPVMAGNGTFFIEVKGRGGHASQPEASRDPVLAAAAITLNLQQIVSRRLPPQSPAVVTVASIEAPSYDTIIPDTARLSGSIRIAEPGIRDTVNVLIREIAQDTARAYGVEAAVEIQPRYGVTVNAPRAAAHFRDALQHELGDAWKATDARLPFMASEDFSYYLQEVPGAFALIGMSANGQHDAPCHSPQYRFNDALIPTVTRLFSTLAGAPTPTA